jgi:hypothetical protein
VTRLIPERVEKVLRGGLSEDRTLNGITRSDTVGYAMESLCNYFTIKS